MLPLLGYFKKQQGEVTHPYDQHQEEQQEVYLDLGKDQETEEHPVDENKEQDKEQPDDWDKELDVEHYMT